MDTNHLFALERIKRDLDGASDINQVRDVAMSFARLYYAQQATLKTMEEKGWLPHH